MKEAGRTTWPLLVRTMRRCVHAAGNVQQGITPFEMPASQRHPRPGAIQSEKSVACSRRVPRQTARVPARGGDRRTSDCLVDMPGQARSGMQANRIREAAVAPELVFERYEKLKREHMGTASWCPDADFKFGPMILEAHGGSWSPPPAVCSIEWRGEYPWQQARQGRTSL